MSQSRGGHNPRMEMENDPDLGIGRRNQCEGMRWFGEHNTGQEVITGTKAGGRSPKFGTSEIGGRRIEPENQRTEAVRSNGKEAGQLNHKVVGRPNQKKGGWMVEPEEGGWIVEPEGPRQEDLGPNEGEATTNKRKKLKLEEKGQRELAGEGIKSWR
ncbi:hypothetical protein B0H14DRAFT_2559202 [Mycena olivaceomarginata]|nr:hypothetical protein B0H14DRAFT_2559202 [Mycena olivaceomarginata]